jgi:hypothetical protein
MSNVSWEEDMKLKIPACFKDNVYHHGKLKNLKTRLNGIRNALIINDEIDTGDKEYQTLHTILNDSGILDIKNMEERNIRFVFVSATMINELRDLYEWGDKHYTHHMLIPKNYIGHKEFLELGIIQEYYPINDRKSAENWVKEDILKNYGSDYRVHIIRTNEKNKDYIFQACIKYKIDFRNHTSTQRINHEKLSHIFNNVSNHLVIAVKGFYRRANLIPNEWKRKIGATHELYVKKYDTNVQVQGLPGRMSGYWKDVLMNGHKTGPYRTSIDAIKKYEEFYKNPSGIIKYSFISSKKTFINPTHIKHLEINNPPKNTNKRVPVILDDLDSNNLIFTKTNKKDKIAALLSILNEKGQYVKLVNFIKNPDVSCSLISRPRNETSIRKHIIDVVNASRSNTPFIIDLDDSCRKKSNWKMFIDTNGCRVCIVIWSLDPDVY